MLIGSEQIGGDFGMALRARVVATAVSGADPTIMLTGPTPATEKALKTAGHARRHRRLGAQRGLRGRRAQVGQDFDLDINKVNVNGGAIAMGHPLGATGAIITGIVLDELERSGADTASSRCASAGHGSGHHHRARLSRGEEQRRPEHMTENMITWDQDADGIVTL